MIDLGSSSISIPLVFNVKREGTTIFGRYAAVMKTSWMEASVLIVFG